MNIVHLPDVLLNSATSFDPYGVMFYYHTGHDSNYRSKIAFNTNCIGFLITGQKYVATGGQNIYYDNRSCLLFKIGNYLSTEISSDGKPYHSLLMFFNDTIFQNFKHRYHHLLTGGKSECPKRSYLYYETDTFIENFKITSCQALTESEKFSRAMQIIKFEEIMLYLSEQHGREVIDFFDHKISNDEINTLKNIVESNSLNNITLDELAFLCAMSRSTFQRKFIEVYGKSPGQWQMEKRLDHSAFLLKSKKLNPSEIYEEVGFSNLSSFTQSFKKKFGLTPKRYQVS